MSRTVLSGFARNTFNNIYYARIDFNEMATTANPLNFFIPVNIETIKQTNFSFIDWTILFKWNSDQICHIIFNGILYQYNVNEVIIIKEINHIAGDFKINYNKETDYKSIFSGFNVIIQPMEGGNTTIVGSISLSSTI